MFGDNKLEELSEVFQNSEELFLGDPVWWECYSQIDSSKITNRNSREYRNVKCIFFEICLFWIFAASFLWDSFIFLQTKPVSRVSNIHAQFWNFSSSTDDFWLWAENDLIGKLYGDVPEGPAVVQVSGSVVSESPGSNFTVSSTPGVVVNTDMVLIGSVRLRQLRVTKGECTNDFNYYNIGSFCTADYASGVNDDRSSFYDSDFPKYLEPAFQYSPNLVGGSIRRGNILYPPEGYVFDLPPDGSESLQALSDLAELGWIDAQTSAIIVEANFYHPVSDMFVVDRFVWEFSSANLARATHESFMFPSATISITWSTESLSATLFSVDVVTLVLFLAGFAWYGFQIFSVNLPRLSKSVWFYVDTVFLCLFVALIACRSSMYTTMSGDVIGTSQFGQPDTFFPFSKLVSLQQAIWGLQASLFVMLFIRGLKLVYLGGAFLKNLLLLAINTMRDYLTIACLICIGLIGFSIAYYVQLGTSDTDFESIEGAFVSTGLSAVSVINFKSEWIYYSFMSLITVWWGYYIYLILFPLLIVVAVWQKAIHRNVELTLTTGAITALLSTWIKPNNILVEAVDESEGIDIDLLPVIVKKHILVRRRQLRDKTEALYHVSAEDYDENDDFVSLQELERIVSQDTLVKEILGNPRAALVKYQKDDEEVLANELAQKVHQAESHGVQFGVEMDPKIRQVSQELSKLISATKNRADLDISPVLKNVNSLLQTMNTIHQRIQRATMRRASRTSIN